jgi:signal transduction histidine kinase
MSRLIRDVLEYSRLSNTGLPFRPVPLDEVFREVLTEFDLQIVEKRAIVVAPELPVVPGIPAQLYQLFRNLIGNALKFSLRDPVITVTAEECAGFAKLIFRDNGIGFPQEYASTIFRIFQRLNRQDAYAGSGIGLSLCKKIVDNHHGTITAEGEPDVGSTFTVCLPLQSPPPLAGPL